MQQHVGRAGRIDAERRADDAAARQRRLDDVGLEVLVEVVGHAHCPEAVRVVHLVFAHLRELPADVEQAEQVARVERGRVGRRGQEEIANQPALPLRVGRVTHVGVGIAARVSRHLAVGDDRVVVAAEIVAVLRERDRAAVRRDLQAVAVQFERPVDLRTQQAADVGAVRVDPVLVEIPADGRAADVVVLLEAEHLEPRAREKRRGREPVVPGAEDENVETQGSPSSIASSRRSSARSQST